MPDQKKQARVFISHSSQDKSFVRKLINDLKTKNLAVWFDEESLKPGDSIVAGISEGLKDTDYLVVVLSQASITSGWVQAELSSALMDQFSNRGTSVIPIKIDDCDVPVLLRDRVYADFRTDYDKGLNSLLAVFEQESKSIAALMTPTESVFNTSCTSQLSQVKSADLRRRVKDRLNRSEVRTVWYDTLNRDMEDDMANRPLYDCVFELFLRVEKQQIGTTLIENLCAERPDIINPC